MGGRADGRAMQGVQKGDGGIWGPGDVHVNNTDTPVSSTYRSQDGAPTAEFPPTLQHLCLSPPLASPTFTTPYTHESIYSPACLPRATAYHPSSTNSPPPPTHTHTPRHPSDPAPLPPCPIPSIVSLGDMRSEVHTFLFLLSSLSPGAF